MRWFRWKVRKWSIWHSAPSATGKTRCGLQIPTISTHKKGARIQDVSVMEQIIPRLCKRCDQ